MHVHLRYRVRWSAVLQGGGRTSGQPVVQTRMEQSGPPQPTSQKQRPWRQVPLPVQSLSSSVMHVRRPGSPHISSSGGHMAP